MFCNLFNIYKQILLIGEFIHYEYVYISFDVHYTYDCFKVNNVL